MSTDAQPLTDAAPVTNGTPPPADVDPRPDLPRWEPGPDKLPLSISWREHIRDLRWIDEQFHCYGFGPYVGMHVAVWNRKVIDSDTNLLELRARLKNLPDADGRRATLTYIATAPDE